MAAPLPPETWPLPRGKREFKTAQQQLSAIRVAQPRTRLLTFQLQGGGANERDSFSLGVMRGPAIIREVQWRSSTAFDPATRTLELGYATAPVSETGVNVGLAKPWNRIPELTDDQNNPVNPQAAGFWLWTTTETGTWIRAKLNYLVSLAEWYPVVSFSNTGGVAVTRIYGWMSVLEDVNPRAIEVMY